MDRHKAKGARKGIGYAFMKSIGYYNGETGPLEEMRVPMNDRACYFGDGIYEATTVRSFLPFALEEHLDRMESSARLLRLPLPMEREKIREELLRMCASVEQGDSQLYWQISRATAMRSHAFPKGEYSSNLWITVRPFRMRKVDESYALCSVPDTRYLHCNIKTINLVPNVLAAQTAAEKGCEEAVFHRDGVVTEGSHTNMHILKDGVLRTAPLSNWILPGITRAHLLTLAREMGIPVREEAFTLQEMQEADEVFFTSSSAFCCRACALDGRPIGGRDEKTLKRLQEAYMQKFLKETSGKNPYLGESR